MAPLVSRHARSVLAVAFVFGRLHAQPSDRYTARSWNVEHGLPQSSVRCITQTHDGYLWIGTWNGLARFDGVSMKVFNGLNTPNFNPSIICVYEDRQRRMWIGTDGGGLLQYRNGAFFRMDGATVGSAPAVNSIAEDPEGRVWFATSSGIAIYDGERFLRFSTEDGLPNLSATVVFAAPDGTMLVEFISTVHRLRLTGDRLIQVEPPFATGGYRFAVDSSGSMWYTKRGRGLVRRTGSREEVDGRFAGLHPKETFVLPGGQIWVLTPKGGYVLEKGRIEQVQYVGTVDCSNISYVFRDREAIVWIAVEGGGLIRLLPKQVHAVTTDDGLETNSIMCGTEDRSGAVWIGTWLGGLARATDRMGNSFESIPELSNGTTVMAVSEAPNGTMWVGTWARGVHTIRDGRVRPWVGHGLAGESTIRAIVSDSSGVWIAGVYSSLWHIRPDGVSVWDTSNGLPPSIINSLIRTRGGEIWFGTDGSGVVRIADGHITIVDTRHGLANLFAHVALEDTDGQLWLTSKSGIQRWKNGVLSTIDARHGFDDDPAQLIQDDEGNFWVGGTHGIHRIGREELNAAADGRSSRLNFLTLGKADGMPLQEVAGGSNQHTWKTRSGMIWFSTTQGAARFDPRAVSSSPVRPGVVVEDVLVEHRSVRMSDEIVLGPDETKIEFRYTGISFASPENIRFRYMLEGFDEAWRDVGRERYAQYTNLAPGTYTFRVTAANAAGVWNENGASVVLRALPPFWATWWFRGIAVLFFLSVGPIIYWRRVTGLKREQARQREFSRKLIEQQESERQRIAGELHDGLGQQLLVIKNRLLMSMPTTPSDRGEDQPLAQISEVVSNAIEEVRSISHNLRPHQLDQLGLTKTLRAVVRQLRESTQLIVTAQLDDIDGVLRGEEEISLFRIVQEALNNVTKHSGASEVRVTVRRDPATVSIEIADNGHGFNMDHRPNAEPFGSSFGVSGMSERAKMFGWTFTMDSAEGRGTTVRVDISIETRKAVS